MFQLKYIAW